MPNFSDWGDSTINAADRAADAWARIQRDPTSVQFMRIGTLQPAQTVRIVISSSSIRETDGSSGATVTRMTVIVFGIQDHATLADTDMQIGDRFFLETQEYEIRTVVAANGERQGFAERYG